MSETDPRPTLFDLRRDENSRLYRFNTDRVINILRVDLEGRSRKVLLNMLRDQPVKKADAEKVLLALSRMFDSDDEFSLSTVKVKLEVEDSNAK